MVQNATDHGELEPVVEPVEKNLGKLPAEVSGDAGYSSYDNLEYVRERRLDMLCRIIFWRRWRRNLKKREDVTKVSFSTMKAMISIGVQSGRS